MILGRIGLIICGFVMGLCLRKEIELFQQWKEDRRIRNKSRLRYTGNIGIAKIK